MAEHSEKDQSPNAEEKKEAEESEENDNGGRGGENEDENGGEEEEYEEEDEDDEEEEEEEEEGERKSGGGPPSEKAKVERLLRRLSSRPVRLHVHDVVIRGNAKTKDSLIEAEVLDAFRSACTMQELFQVAGAANERLRRMDVFDSVSITLDAGPPELPGTANVTIDVVEAKNPLTGDLGIFSKPEARSWSLEGSLKLKNLSGYGDIWDASGAYSWDQTSEISAGLSLPRFKAISTPLMARVSLLSQDWLRVSSYKEHLLGLSFSLLSTTHHNLAYNLTWRTLTDPNRKASKIVRRLLGHSLLSSVKYVYKIDRRDSHLRPTCGYAFLSTTQVGGLGPYSKSLRFIRQEFDLRGAFSLGFYKSALNIGVAAGIILPWGRGFMDSPSPLPDRFYMGGHSSPVCNMSGPTSLLGFRTRGLGPADSRRFIPTKSDKHDSPSSPERDVLGGDLAVTAFADLSFDLPLKPFRESGIHGHVFINAGNLAKLTENKFKDFSFRNFGESFRSSAGFGIIFPTKLFRMEINYCYILKQFGRDNGKTGLQFNFSSP